MSSFHTRQSKIVVISLFVLSCVVLITYNPALKIGFAFDDYVFVQWAAQVPGGQYIIDSLNPWSPSLNYRPALKILYLLNYFLFRFESGYYHLVQILIHLGNCLLLFSVVKQLSNKWQLAWIAALTFGGLGIYSVAVFWISVHDPLVGFFSLFTVRSWLCYLQTERKRDYALTVVAFALALLSKEISVSIPVVLFLLDRLFITRQTSVFALLRRYLLLGAISLLYATLIYVIYSNNPPLVEAAPSLSHVIPNLLSYAAMLVFPWRHAVLPWGLASPVNHELLLFVLPLLLIITVVKRTVVPAFLSVIALLNIALLLGNPFGTDPRYLYLSGISVAVGLALLLEVARALLDRYGRTMLLTLGVTVLVFVNGLDVAETAATITEIARQRRVPIRDIERQHPMFPDNTLLFFVDPVVSSPYWEGIFFQRYGSSVSVKGANRDGTPWTGGRLRSDYARLRDYAAAYVYYFDETGRPIEVQVDRDAQTWASVEFPVSFESSILFEGYEITTSTLKRGKPLVLLLYWRPTGRVGRDLTVFVHLLNENGEMLLGTDSQPAQGKLPTSIWRNGELVVDGHVLQIPSDLPGGSNYRLSVGLYYLPTLERLHMLDQAGQPTTDSVTICCFNVAP